MALSMCVAQVAGIDLSGWLDPINMPGVRISADVIVPQSITLPETPQRAQVNDTLNFRIPDAICAGTIRVEAEVFVENFGGDGNVPGISERVSANFGSFTFHRRRRLKIRFIPVKLNADPNGVLTASSRFENPPTDEQCRDFILRSMKFIPAHADVSRLDGWSTEISIATISITTPDGTTTTLDSPIPTGSQSLNFDVKANLFLEWVGLNHDQDNGEIWAILVPSDSSWGRAHIGAGEFLTRMTVDSAAHELAHCLGQEHISTPCPRGRPAIGGDTPASWGEDGGAVVDVPFDIGGNGTVTSSTGVWELMTYCDPRFTSPKRWRRLFERIGE